jgi:hypothetical protein
MSSWRSSGVSARRKKLPFRLGSGLRLPFVGSSSVLAVFLELNSPYYRVTSNVLQAPARDVQATFHIEKREAFRGIALAEIAGRNRCGRARKENLRGCERLRRRCICEESKSPSPSQARALRSSWSVPPQCEKDIRWALREDFSNVKSRLNIDSKRWRISRHDRSAKIKLWLRTRPSLPS